MPEPDCYIRITLTSTRISSSTVVYVLEMILLTKANAQADRHQDPFRARSKLFLELRRFHYHLSSNVLVTVKPFPSPHTAACTCSFQSLHSQSCPSAAPKHLPFLVGTRFVAHYSTITNCTYQSTTRLSTSSGQGKPGFTSV